MKTHLCCPENSGFRSRKAELVWVLWICGQTGAGRLFILFWVARNRSAHAQNRLCHKKSFGEFLVTCACGWRSKIAASRSVSICNRTTLIYLTYPKAFWYSDFLALHHRNIIYIRHLSLHCHTSHGWTLHDHNAFDYVVRKE